MPAPHQEADRLRPDEAGVEQALVAPCREAADVEVEIALEQRLAQHVAGRDLDIDRHPRHRKPRLADRRQHVFDRGPGDRPDIGLASAAVGEFAQFAFGLVDLEQRTSGAPRKGAPGRRQFDAPAGPLVERRTGDQRRLRREPGGGRLRNGETGRGRAHLPGFGERREQTQVRNLESLAQDAGRSATLGSIHLGIAIYRKRHIRIAQSDLTVISHGGRLAIAAARCSSNRGSKRRQLRAAAGWEDKLKTFMKALAGAAMASMLAFGPASAQDKGTIGIAMPTKSSARWISDGNSMVEQFTQAGYATDLQYAEDDIPNQLAQIENMITKGVNVLVIAAIDGTTLSNALENAAASGIKVIAYDRLIRDSPNVDYYATFDNFKVGVQQATSLVNGLKERFPDMKPWNVELFGGSPDDNNAYFFYDGAMSVLQPLIDSGDITVVSGQMGMDTVGTLRWDGAVAQSRMDNLLSA